MQLIEKAPPINQDSLVIRFLKILSPFHADNQHSFYLILQSFIPKEHNRAAYARTHLSLCILFVG